MGELMSKMKQINLIHEPKMNSDKHFNKMGSMALAFRDIYLSVDTELPQTNTGEDLIESHIDIALRNVAGYANLAFSCELFFKALILRTNPSNEPPYTHKLADLYKVVKDYYPSIIINENVLKENEDAFTKIRYLDSGSFQGAKIAVKSFNIEFLRILNDILFAEYSKSKI